MRREHPMHPVEQELVQVLTAMVDPPLWQYTTTQGLHHWPRAHKSFAGHYRSPADFLLKHGEFITPRVTPAKYPGLAAKACFANAFILATQFPELTYMEGIIYAPPMVDARNGVRVGKIRPVHHAWCVDAQDRLVECTYVTTAGAVAMLRDNHAYVGARFPDLITVKARVWDGGETMLDDPSNRYRLMRRPYVEPPEKIVPTLDEDLQTAIEAYFRVQRA